MLTAERTQKQDIMLLRQLQLTDLASWYRSRCSSTPGGACGARWAAMCYVLGAGGVRCSSGWGTADVGAADRVAEQGSWLASPAALPPPRQPLYSGDPACCLLLQASTSARDTSTSSAVTTVKSARRWLQARFLAHLGLGCSRLPGDHSHGSPSHKVLYQWLTSPMSFGLIKVCRNPAEGTEVAAELATPCCAALRGGQNPFPPAHARFLRSAHSITRPPIQQASGHRSSRRAPRKWRP